MRVCFLLERRWNLANGFLVTLSNSVRALPQDGFAVSSAEFGRLFLGVPGRGHKGPPLASSLPRAQLERCDARRRRSTFSIVPWWPAPPGREPRQSWSLDSPPSPSPALPPRPPTCRCRRAVLKTYLTYLLQFLLTYLLLCSFMINYRCVPRLLLSISLLRWDFARTLPQQSRCRSTPPGPARQAAPASVHRAGWGSCDCIAPLLLRNLDAPPFPP